MDYAAARAGRRPGRAAPQELHPPGADAVQDRGRRALRHGRVRQGHGYLPAEGRLERDRRPARRGRPKRPLRGIGMCYYIEFDHGRPDRARGDRVRARTARSRSWSAPRPTARATTPPTPRCCTSASTCRSRRSGSSRATPTAIQAGGGTGGSRSLTAQGMAITDASDARDRARQGVRRAGVRDRGRRHPVHTKATFRVAGTDRAIDIMELAGKARAMAPSLGMEGGLDAAATTSSQRLDLPQRLPHRRGRGRPRHRHGAR